VRPSACLTAARIPLLLVALAVLVPACGDGDDDGMAGPGGPVNVPAAWAGVWQVHTVERDCDSSTLLDETTETETLCTGQELDFDEEGVASLDCSGTVTDTVVDITCTASFVVEGTTYTTTAEIDLVRDGDSYSGTGRVTVREGTNVVECWAETVDATRISGEPTPCTPSAAFRPRLEAVVADRLASR